MKTLANKTVLKLGPELGLCIALHSSSMPDHATGHLFQGKPGREYGTHPAPDLKAVVILWGGSDEGDHMLAQAPQQQSMMPRRFAR